MDAGGHFPLRTRDGGGWAGAWQTVRAVQGDLLPIVQLHPLWALACDRFARSVSRLAP